MRLRGNSSSQRILGQLRNLLQNPLRPNFSEVVPEARIAVDVALSFCLKTRNTCRMVRAETNQERKRHININLFGR